jgi:hypothetical protein
MSVLTGLDPSQHGRDIPYCFIIEWNEFNDRIPSFRLWRSVSASATRAVAHRIRDAPTMPLSIDDGYFT